MCVNIGEPVVEYCYKTFRLKLFIPIEWRGLNTHYVLVSSCVTGLISMTFLRSCLAAHKDKMNSMNSIHVKRLQPRKRPMLPPSSPVSWRVVRDMISLQGLLVAYSVLLLYGRRVLAINIKLRRKFRWLHYNYQSRGTPLDGLYKYVRFFHEQRKRKLMRTSILFLRLIICYR